jgi:hypothetical protein
MMRHFSRFQLYIATFCIVMSTFSRDAGSQDVRTLGLAVLDLQAYGISESEASALSDMLRSSVTKTILAEKDRLSNTYRLIERSQMDKILGEFQIQNSGCTDLSCAVEFGKLLNADRIIIGSVSLVGSTYMVIARIIDVETGTAITSVDRRQQGIIDNVIDLMPMVARELLTGEQFDMQNDKNIFSGNRITRSHLAYDTAIAYNLPTSDFDDSFKPGFGINSDVFYTLSAIPKLGVGGRFAWSTFGIDKNETGFDDGGITFIEMIPSVRYFFTPAQSRFGFFSQAGIGFYKWKLKIESGFGDFADSGTDSGCCFGVGVTGRFTDTISFFAMPLFHIVKTENERTKYYSLDFGVLFR